MKKLMKAVAALMLMTAVVYPAESMNAQTHKGHDYVDLGLPSGTLWATCNVGASQPEGFGNYYSWGETRTKTVYGWENYKQSNGANKLTKYCTDSQYGNNSFTDRLTNLQTSDDPAASWGNGWHSPTKAQWEELLNNTTNSWTTRRGVQGFLFTARNGRQLFLPAAGCRNNSELISPGGHYWSSSLYIDTPVYAWEFVFDSSDSFVAANYRYNGLSVRPVCSAK